MKLRLLFSVIQLIFWQSILFADNYPEVVFDNSLIPGAYAKSHISYEGSSWIENVNGHLPVSDSVFFTPGNALSLKYINSSQGKWNSLIRYSRQKFHYKVSSSDVLSLKLYVQTTWTDKNNLPSLSIKHKDGESSVVYLKDFIEDFAHNTWLDVKIPIAKIRGLEVENPIAGVIFHQNGSMGREHHVFVDQIEFLPKTYSQVKLSSPAILSKITSYDHHVYLQWQLPLTPSIRYIKIYRSEDNKSFEPVTMRPIQMQGCLDYVPEMDKTYYYKIAWVDYDYKESPFSEIKEVKTSRLSQDKLLDFIQLTHINYFVENYDINSGMHMPFRTKDKAIVATSETSGALLSLLIGVEKGFVSKNIFIDRVKRIVSFLEKSPSKYGIFPSYYDGRSRVPEHLEKRPHYSVQATTSLLEALLVVRQYLSTDKDDERVLGEKITQLYDQVEWNKLTLNDSTDVIHSHIDVVDEVSNIRPLTGFNHNINSYLLAAASKQHPISAKSFTNHLAYEYIDLNAITDSLFLDSINSNLQLDSGSMDFLFSLQDTLVRHSILKDTTLYGLNVPFGEWNQSLLELYRPFMTINPEHANTKKYKLGAVVTNYTKIAKRRDNQIGVGTPSANIWGFYKGRDTIMQDKINPAVSISSIFVDKQLGVESVMALYRQFGSMMFTEYGFRAWIDLQGYDISDEYLSLNQSSVAIAIENAQSGLIWRLYGEIPEIKSIQQQFFDENN